MIQFNYEISFKLEREEALGKWISDCIKSNGYKEGEINYIFCDDDYLHKLNVEFLQHDTLTDIISFDYSLGKELNGDIFISIERVRDNAGDLTVDFNTELNRVMVHGILHYMGFKDKTKEELVAMRNMEDLQLNRLKH